MKMKKYMLPVLMMAVMLSMLFAPLGSVETVRAETIMNVGASVNVVSLGSDVITYNSIYSESRQIPCESRGGIYFLNDNVLSFYTVSTNKAAVVYTFENASMQDSFVAGDKLYILETEYWSNRSVISVYDLKNQQCAQTITLDINATHIGADSSGRIYLTSSDDGKTVFSLYSASGQLLSSAKSEFDVYDFGAFDSKNGNFYYEGYYNWVYWGYDHDMHALRVGNVSGNQITVNDEAILLISQSYWYEKQNPIDMLGSKYLGIDSTFNSMLRVWDSNKLNAKKISDTEVLTISRESGSDFDATDSVGIRAVYRESVNSVVASIDRQTIAEYDLSTGEEIVRTKSTHPVFSMMKYGDNIAVVEKEGDKFYLEMIPWKDATKVSIQAAKKGNMKVGETKTLTALTNGTLEESFTWSSSNRKIVSVSQSGSIFAWSKGSAVITVKTKRGLKATYTVKVTSDTSVSDPKKNNIVTKGVKSQNKSDNNYSVWGSTVNSYLAQASNGSLIRVEGRAKDILVETYSTGGTLKSKKTLKKELSDFGGFYSGSDAYYLVFGKMNKSESDKTEIMRVVKYSKSWKRIKQLSIKGANTYIPFDAGSLRMTEVDGKLYIYTCHEMYQSSDGLHHQANMTYVVNESSMKLEQSYYDVMNIAQAGYVSHSFNQFIQTDGEYVYRVDHGDAYPRAISITKCLVNGDITDVSYTLPVDLSNVPGYNDTGASVGGFELSSDSCIIAGNAVDITKKNVSSGDVRNIFVSVTHKGFAKKSELAWITKYDSKKGITVRTPQLVKLGSDQFLLMWEEVNKKKDTVSTKMVTIDGSGNKTSDVVTSKMPLSDCQPIVCKDKLVRWYTTDNDVPILFAVNPYHLNTAVVVEKAPATVKIQKSTSAKTSVKLTWKAVSGASGYRIYYKKASAKKWKTATTLESGKKTSYKLTGLKAGTAYDFKIKAYSDMWYGTTWGKESKVYAAATTPAAVKIKKTSPAQTSVTLTWGKTSCSGYQLQQYNASKKKWVTVKNVAASKTKYKVTGLKKGTSYKFRIRTYVKAGKNKVYSQWSETVTIKTKK